MVIDPSIVSNALASLVAETMGPILRVGFDAETGPLGALPPASNYDVAVRFDVSKLFPPAYLLSAAGAATKASVRATARSFTLAAAEAHRQAALDILRNGHESIPPNRGMYAELKRMGLLRVIKTSEPGRIIEAPAGAHGLSEITGELEAGIAGAHVQGRDSLAESAGDVSTVVIYDRPEYLTAVLEGHRSTIPRNPELSAYYSRMRRELGLEGIPRPNPHVPARPFLAVAETMIEGELQSLWTDEVNNLEEELRVIFALDPGQRSPGELTRLILNLRQNRLITYQQRNTNSIFAAVNGRMVRVFRGNAEVSLTQDVFQGRFNSDVESALAASGGAGGDSIQRGVNVGGGGGGSLFPTIPGFDGGGAGADALGAMAVSGVAAGAGRALARRA